jgi:hypothetical protein
MSRNEEKVTCNKQGGVCCLRLYEETERPGYAHPACGDQGRYVTVCPNRFDENGIIYEWIGSEILQDPEPRVLNEIGFLEAVKPLVDRSRDDVGRIDNVLVSLRGDSLSWCALEKQAVYFQGDAMGKEWPAIRSSTEDCLPFPVATRRPDYRSSGPKRLMPQLQIKVPTLRRWGKKMAVVIDESFFDALGDMEQVKDISNCDIAWFVVRYESTSEGVVLRRKCTVFTTLERAVEGLTAGNPVSLSTFEDRIREKLAKTNRK